MFLTLAMMLLLVGCGIPARSAAQTMAEVTVHNVDELIAAIAPGAVIRLEEGVYDLNRAESYGKRSGNPYVKWKGIFENGYELTIHDLDGLTLLGSGKGTTEFLSRCEATNVLVFEDCTNLHLIGFTAGHSVQVGGCSAGVIYVERCENVTMQQLGLYGCGSVGIDARQTDRLSIHQVDIYECSNTGLSFYNCRYTTVDGCRVYNNGKFLDGWNQGYAAVSVGSCEDLTISDTQFDGNTLCYFLSAFGSQKIRIQDCDVTNNTFTDAVFSLAGADVVVETNCRFADNVFSHWYERGWEDTETNRAKDEHGNPIFTEDPEPLHANAEPAEAMPVITGEQKQVVVSTVEGFLAAIDSNTLIILEDGEYNLSTVGNYSFQSGAHYHWEQEYDGAELVITDVENLSIISRSGDPKNCVISVEPRYADVLTFQGCRNVMIQGVTAGHTKEPGSCAGGVLYWDNCSDLLVDNCRLYGCGILGVSAWQCQNLQVINSSIYECSYGGIQCYQCQSITVGGCDFWDLGGDMFQFSGCENVRINGHETGGNYHGD